MYQRFFNPPKDSYFLFGPRGTGKSTFLRSYYPDAFWVDLLDPETFRIFAAAPERLYQILGTISEKTIVIDEIQRVPELLNVVHKCIEEKKGYQFILTGSSARKLREKGTNLLAGRALLCYMPPFFAKEIGQAFELSKHLRLGMLPVVLDSLLPEEVIKAYVGIYLKEEVQAEGLVRNIGDFARFLETMSFSHASVVNTSNIARESHIARKTVENYLIVLNDLLLSFQLDVFRYKAKRSLMQHSKFYFFDAGVYSSLRPKQFFDVVSESEGAALEGLVAQHLMAWLRAQQENYQLHFWRTGAGVEVDFILTGHDTFLALEVKNGTTLHPSDFRGLHSFAEDYPSATLVILYRGKEKYREKNVLAYPVEEFLKQIDPAEKIQLK
ncbi:MAG: ATPase [Chlamydiae bacterium RIFCSPHIGHO2_12_FULL_49_11]|nr:MAG: ATPase [Chlamydiae bacterium RIFCSPHIGHO2_12_FULL_49_11]